MGRFAFIGFALLVLFALAACGGAPARTTAPPTTAPVTTTITALITASATEARSTTTAPTTPPTTIEATTTTEEAREAEILTLDDASAALLEPTAYVHPTEGFSIRPPKGWVASANAHIGGRLILVLLVGQPLEPSKPTEPGIYPYILVFSDDMGNLSLYDYVLAHAASIEGGFNAFTVTDGPTSVIVNGASAYMSEIVFSAGDRCSRMMMAKGTTVYELLGTAPSSFWEQFRPSVYASFLTFTPAE